MNRSDAERFVNELDETITEFVRLGTQASRERGAPPRAQLYVMRVLHREGPLRMSDLASLLDVTSPAVSGLVTELVKCGHASRTEDPDDRRATFVQLTPEGRRTFEEVQQRRRERVIELLLHFSPEEMEAFLGTLKRMSHLLYQRGSGGTR